MTRPQTDSQTDGAAWPTLSGMAALAAAALGADEDAWLVGGAVRDALLGQSAGDFDLAVRGDAGRFATTLAAELGAAVFAYSERFSTYRIVGGAGRHVDVAPLRGATIADDLRARDFTVNAMALDVRGAWPAAGELGTPPLASAVDASPAAASAAIAEPPAVLIDPLGGWADLRAARLRLCASAALTDDPVRVLRLARFACGLALTPEPGLEQAGRAAAGGLSSVSGERLERELSALLALPQCVPALRMLDACGGLAAVLPELTALKDVTQNHFHHLDVFAHTLEALEYLPGIVAQLDGDAWLTSPADLGMPNMAPLVPLAYAVLLHDLGKPAAKRVDDDGRVMFLRHDEIGVNLAADICRRLKVSRRFEQFVTLLVRQHLRLGFLVREQPLTQRALAHYRRDVEPYVFESVVLSLADRMATRGEKTSPVSIARHFRLARDVWGEIAKEAPTPLLSGAEVMRLLGIGQGQEVGEALTAVHEEVEAGELHSKNEAQAWLRSWWEGRQAASPAAAGDADAPPAAEDAASPPASPSADAPISPSADELSASPPVDA